MARRVIIVPSKMSDVYALVKNMRERDREEIISLGGDPRKIVRENFKGAFLRWTMFVDGRIAAMSGLYGEALSDVGYPYMFTTPEFEKVPVAAVKAGRRMVTEMFRYRQRLESYVAASYHQSCKYHEGLGFKLHDPEPRGAHGALFRKMTLSREAL